MSTESADTDTDRAWLVYDPCEEGALCLVASSAEEAWAKAAPDLGYEVSDDDGRDEHTIRPVTAAEVEEAWDERAALLEGLYGVLRVLRPNPNIHPTGPQDLSADLTEALDECAKLAKWGWSKPRAVAEKRAQPKGVRDVLAEREKQRAKWGDKHDDEHDDGDLADVARLLINEQFNTFDMDLRNAGWGVRLYAKHGTDRRTRLVIAAALLLAEIERLDRANPQPTPTE